MNNLSVQDQYSPQSICFGCGPVNEKGLRLKSFLSGDELVATFFPLDHHQAFPGMLNGGICGALLDCHSNWTAAMNLMKAQGLQAPPCTVTGDFHVRLLKPTPVDTELSLRAWVEHLEGDRARIAAELKANDKITATCLGNFVAVREGHPAYNRW